MVHHLVLLIWRYSITYFLMDFECRNSTKKVTYFFWLLCRLLLLYSNLLTSSDNLNRLMQLSKIYRNFFVHYFRDFQRINNIRIIIFEWKEGIRSLNINILLFRFIHEIKFLKFQSWLLA